MKERNHWELLRSGKLQPGIDYLETLHAAQSDAAHIIMELGIAYLWAREYEAASQHFRRAIRDDPHPVSDLYGMAGAANWCLGDADEAVKQWNFGLEADFADTAGLGIGLPLLLFAASVLRPTIFRKDVAKEILMEKVKDSRVNIWPGPIARWLLAQIDENAIENQCHDKHEAETQSRLWQADFYKAVELHGAGKTEESKELMRCLANTSGSEWGDEALFLALIWNEEFFIARHDGSLK